MTRALSMAVLITMMASVPAVAGPLTIGYTATDLDDIGPADLWEYSYFFGGYEFAANEGFTLSFDSTLFGALDVSQAGLGSDWDVLLIEPETDPPVFLEFRFDALALADGATVSDPLILRFDWLGGGVPSVPQLFEHYRIGPDLGLELLGGGTVTPVPEPSSLLLLGTGAALFRLRQRRRQRPVPPAAGPSIN